jgi:redox-sensitive bicupin YhaK (pirin superfamily)
VLFRSLGGVEGAVASPHPALGAELRLDGTAPLSLRPDFEHALLWLEGEASADGEALPTDVLVALPRGTSSVTLAGRGVGVLLGGAPFGPLLLWWNFAARTRAELEAARAAWESGAFGPVPGAEGRIPAPEVPPLADAR